MNKCKFILPVDPLCESTVCTACGGTWLLPSYAGACTSDKDVGEYHLGKDKRKLGRYDTRRSKHTLSIKLG